MARVGMPKNLQNCAWHCPRDQPLEPFSTCMHANQGACKQEWAPLVDHEFTFTVNLSANQQDNASLWYGTAHVTTAWSWQQASVPMWQVCPTMNPSQMMQRHELGMRGILADAAVHGNGRLVDAGLSRHNRGLHCALARALPAQLVLQVSQLHNTRSVPQSSNLYSMCDFSHRGSAKDESVPTQKLLVLSLHRNPGGSKTLMTTPQHSNGTNGRTGRKLQKVQLFKHSW